MTRRNFKMFSLVTALAGTFLLAACHKKEAKVTPPPPPAPPVAPTATLAANPDVIQNGQSTTLTWRTTNANDVSIPGLGTLPPSGSRTVTPNMSTTYELAAKGPGGTQDASARVTVNPVPVAKVATPQPDESRLFSKDVKDVYFNFDKYNIRSDQVQVTANDGEFLELWSKDIATIGDRKNTTWRSEPTGRIPSSSLSSSRA
jgi:peptidoglycan-associated lipoprotein